jgi:hypothetical protein
MKTASNILFTQSIVCRSLLSLVKHARVKNKIVPNLDTAIALLISPMPKFTVQGQYFFVEKSSIFVGPKSRAQKPSLPGWQTQAEVRFGLGRKLFLVETVFI